MRKISLLMIVLTVTTLIFPSCKETKRDEAPDARRNVFVAERNLVDTMTLFRTDFYRELISNGLLKGVQRAELRFPNSGQIEKVNVKNGSRIGVGEPIASLNTLSITLDLQSAYQSLEKARLDFYDNLIGYGFGSDTTKIPKDLVDVAKIRSGFSSAELNYRLAEMNLRNAILLAPFSGIIANLNAKPYELSSGIICLVIDDSSFDVDFNLLESELSYVSIGQAVQITLFADKTKIFEGKIKEINPHIDDKGQIGVVASVRGSRDLVDGMNVKVFIKSKVKQQFSVPKSAVVMRDGYDVIFTLDTISMKAQWLYVDILQSNSTHHAIGGSKKKRTEVVEGFVVITEGNLNLADGSNVVIRK